MSDAKPLLSIGVIFKNEIRCLERCFKSVENLKARIPCELVVADTGSSDGSREIAERYADVLIDFPWANDFSAARNAVMDRCSGVWYMTMDADEWLDVDVSELSRFLRSPQKWGNSKACCVTVRNYTQLDLKGDFSDFVAVRAVRMSTGIRYTGTVHEHFDKDVGSVHTLNKTILHHDGYVGFGGERGRPKRERNMELLKEQLRNEPDNLLIRLQCVESSVGQEQIEYLRRAVEGVDEKLPKWKEAGPAIYRYAAFMGTDAKLPESREWISRAWELFPNSMFTKVDISYLQFQTYFQEEKYGEAIPYGKGYLKALKNYREQKGCGVDLLFSSLMMISHSREEFLRVNLLDALYKEKHFREARGLLTTVDFLSVPMKEFLRCVTILLNIHVHGDESMGQPLLELWSKIEALEDGGQRKNALLDAAGSVFTQQFLDSEGGNRHAYTIFLPLEGRCWPGDAAALMEKEKPAALDKILTRQEDLNILPALAVLRALERGAKFPMYGKPMKLEEMDVFAAHLVSEKGNMVPLALSVARREYANMQELCWARTVVIAAVRSFPWEDGEDSFNLARAFATVEKDFLRQSYAPDVLDEDGIFTLPSMHRFGWYAARAFDAFDAGNTTEYVRLLRKGLESCHDMRPMVAFLQKDAEKRAQEQRIHDASPELVQLAEQVKAALAMYPTGDPAVTAVKNSPAYQKVAWLIEDPPMLMAGGIAQ